MLSYFSGNTYMVVVGVTYVIFKPSHEVIITVDSTKYMMHASRIFTVVGVIHICFDAKFCLS